VRYYAQLQETYYRRALPGSANKVEESTSKPEQSTAEAG
jgi:PHD/YefM family antitoxin component YafN of YafNO toxin-antitoxin module